MIRKIKNLIKKIIFTFIKPQVKIKQIYNSYAQAGEDRILMFLFSSMGIKNPSYLEIGAYHSANLSNTYLFYQNGSRGVCVEADKTLIPELKEHRKNDKILNIGIGIDEDTEKTFYIFSEKGLNTFDKEEAEYRASFGTFKIEETTKVKIQTINKVLSENFKEIPTLLLIDIEGLDLAVLQSLDILKFPIPVICVETCKYSENHIKPKDTEIIDFMISKNYFIYADTYINTIFVNKKWFNNYNNK